MRFGKSGSRSRPISGTTDTSLLHPSQPAYPMEDRASGRASTKDASLDGPTEFEKNEHAHASRTESPRSQHALELEKAHDAEAAMPAAGFAADEEEEVEYPKKVKLLLISIALCLSIFCLALDNTIISTAIPHITDQFKALDDVGWYGSAYLLTTCAFQLMYGKLYTFYSIKWVYMACLFIFEVGSFICGIAPNSTALIIGRAVAGLGCAGLFSGAILIIAHTVPLEQRPTYTGIIGSMYGLASVAGPLLGGVFTDKLTWRWCFYINLPFGAVTGIFLFFFFSSPKSIKKTRGLTWKGQLQQFDLIGTAVFLPAIVCLLLALQWGGTKYAWGSWRIILCLVLFAVLITIFIGVQIWKQEEATVPPRVFKHRDVWSTAFFGAMLGAAFFVLVFYIPIWFQAIKGVSAVKSGIMNLPFILGLVVVSVIAGVAVTVLGYYTPFIILSAVFMAIGAGLISTWKVDTGHAKWIGYQFIFGTGVGMGMQQTLIVVQNVLPSADVPIGTAIMMFAQTLGGALFLSVAQNVFSNQLNKNIAALKLPGLPSDLVTMTGATELKRAIQQINADYLAPILVAYNKSLNETFYVSVALASLSLFGALLIRWKSIKGKNIGMGGAA